MIFEDPDELFAHASACYRQARFAEAALLFHQARELARNLGNAAKAFKAAGWEAECYRQQGQYRRSLGLLLEILRNPPPDAAQIQLWNANRSLFRIRGHISPSLAGLRKALHESESLAARQPHPAGDLPHLRGLLAFWRGDWLEGLGCFAQAWQADDNQGYPRSSHAYCAARCALNLRRTKDARAWRDHLSRTDPELEWARWDLVQIEARLALHENDIRSLAACLDNDRWGDRDGPRLEIRVRLALRGDSQLPTDDPCDRFHVARNLLRKLPEDRQEVHHRCEWLLTLVDYRLAALRFEARLPAVDDLYYQRADSIPARLHVADRDAFAERLRRFDRNWRWLDKHARWLDGLLECEWRTREAESRRQRRNAIAEAAGFPPLQSAAP